MKNSHLERALNDMELVLLREHTESQWKWAVLRVLRALAIEVQHPPMQIVNQEVKSMRDIVAKLEARGPQRTFHTEACHPWKSEGTARESTLHEGDSSDSPPSTNTARY